MQRNTGYFPTESLEPSGNRLFSRSALNEGDLFRGSLELENKKAASATEFDNKIAAVKEKIAKLEAKKKDVLTPKKRKPRKSKADQIKLLVRQAQKSGMKLDEIADKLGMALPE